MVDLDGEDMPVYWNEPKATWNEPNYPHLPDDNEEGQSSESRPTSSGYSNESYILSETSMDSGD